MSTAARLDTLRSRWAQLQARERRLIGVAAAVLLPALCWWLLLAPPLQTLRNATQEHERLDSQLTHMRQLQAQALALRQAPQSSVRDAGRTLESLVRAQLGAAAQLQLNGSQATLTLSHVPADALAPWLAQARQQTQVSVSQARLQREAANSPVTWSGTLVLTLPTP